MSKTKNINKRKALLQAQACYLMLTEEFKPLKAIRHLMKSIYFYVGPA